MSRARESRSDVDPQEAPRGGDAARSVPRLFVDRELAAGLEVELPAEAAHYLLGVMRLSEGDRVLLIDDRTGEWRARVTSASRRRAAAEVEMLLRPREPVPDLWLCAAPLKRGRIDWMAEKACELGVARFVPVLTERTMVRRLNGERLRAHMIEAAEQCGRTALPELVEPVTLAGLLAHWDAGRRLIFCDEEGGTPLGELPAAAAGEPQATLAAGFLIGPEGGFTVEERRLIRAHPAAVAVSLGPRVLRADTAAVAAVAAWQALAGDWSSHAAPAASNRA
jgi:16S rRNA (uracil1498-N3)-methyltransferase